MIESEKELVQKEEQDKKVSETTSSKIRGGSWRGGRGVGNADEDSKDKEEKVEEHQMEWRRRRKRRRRRRRRRTWQRPLHPSVTRCRNDVSRSYIALIGISMLSSAASTAETLRGEEHRVNVKSTDEELKIMTCCSSLHSSAAELLTPVVLNHAVARVLRVPIGRAGLSF